MSHLQHRHRKTATLTPQGLQKLELAKLQVKSWSRHSKSCTLATLSEYTGLSSHTLSKIHSGRKVVDLRTLTRYFRTFSLDLEPEDYFQSPQPAKNNQFQNQPILLNCRSGAEVLPSIPFVNWGMAPDISRFCGRTTELETLQQWSLEERCRLIMLVGIGGIGKTWLATKLAEHMQHEFQVVIWCSLQPIPRSHPPISFDELASDLLQHLSPSPNVTIPETTYGKILRLMDELNRTRCLLVLDNFESILQRQILPINSGDKFAETYNSDYDAYSEFLQQLGKGRHQSCVVLTSREEPKQTRHLLGDNSSVRVLMLKGLQVKEIQQILSMKGVFQGSSADWKKLVEYYSGNPLILEMVAVTIQQLFDSSITEFLKHGISISDDIREFLTPQLDCLTKLEQRVINALASHKVPLSFDNLRSHISISSKGDLVESLKSLRSRSLVESKSIYLSLHPLFMNYLSVQQ
jgi:hypothetical protein